jgi:predicted deacetylase
LSIVVFNFIFPQSQLTKQLDDVSPEIPCKENLLKKANVLFIIPKFNNKDISDKKEWCNFILSLNKTLGMHGVHHTYYEFNSTRNETYLDEGVEAFKKCFGFYPKRFKPPQLQINKDNKNLIKKKMKLDLYINQILHKVYHCNDTGKLPNRFIDLF